MRGFTYFPVVVLVIMVVACSATGNVIINEMMYNPDVATQGVDEDYEWVELYNTGPDTAKIGGWRLAAGNPPFVIPSGTEIKAGEYLVICSNVGIIYLEYGISNAIGNFVGRFQLSNGGDTVTLLDNYNHVIDEVTYNDAYPWPFQPDGAGPSLERVNPEGGSNDPHNWAASVPGSEHGTPGRQNSLFSDGTALPVVINEIQYHTASPDEEGEYIELFNASGAAINLGGWKFTNGVSFEFPAGTTIPSLGYLVVCRNADRIRSDYGIENVVGNYDGYLDNGGETIVLRNNTGRLVDFVAYSDGSYWPVAADGYGPSLECINPNLLNNDVADWAASSPTAKWVYVETPPGEPTGEVLYVYLNEPGEVLVDQISLVPEGGGGNLIPNGDFETDDVGWAKYGNHATSARTDTEAHSGTACMKVISTGDGGGGDWGNYIGLSLPGALTADRYVLSFWAKPLGSGTRLTARLANSHGTTGVVAAMDLSEKGLASTPGSENGARSNNLPPFIYHVTNNPPIPNSTSPVWVTARVVDDGVISGVSLEYNVGQGWTSLQMYDDGRHFDHAANDGEYGVSLSSQPSYSIVRLRIVAEDDQGLVSVSPNAGNGISSYAYFCYDRDIVTTLPIYFLFVSEEDLQRLEQMGERDDYVPATLVYNGIVYDDVGARWYGTASERAVTTKKSWRIKLNGWQTLEGTDSLILLSGDYEDGSLRGSASIREAMSYRMFKDAGCAYSETAYLQLRLNGSYYGLMLRVERPDSDYLERNGRDPDGDLYQALRFPGETPSNMSVLPSYDDYAFAYDRKTNRLEPHDSLISLIEGLQNTAEDEIFDFFNDHVNVYLYAGYVAATCFLQDWVSPGRDYYLFLDKNTTNRWEPMPWGGEHNWERPDLSALNGILGDNLYYLPNMMRTRFLANSGLRQIFANRLRSLMEATYTEGRLFTAIDQMYGTIQTDAESDRQHWWPEAASLESHVAAIKENITARRAFLNRWLLGITIVPNSSNADWFDVSWRYEEGKNYTVYWAGELSSWNSLVPAPADIVTDTVAGTVTWTDKGTSPGMDGLPPGQVEQRFYKIEVLSQ